MTPEAILLYMNDVIMLLQQQSWVQIQSCFNWGTSSAVQAVLGFCVWRANWAGSFVWGLKQV